MNWYTCKEKLPEHNKVVLIITKKSIISFAVFKSVIDHVNCTQKMFVIMSWFGQSRYELQQEECHYLERFNHYNPRSVAYWMYFDDVVLPDMSKLEKDIEEEE